MDIVPDCAVSIKNKTRGFGAMQVRGDESVGDLVTKHDARWASTTAFGALVLTGVSAC